MDPHPHPHQHHPHQQHHETAPPLFVEESTPLFVEESTPLLLSIKAPAVCVSLLGETANTTTQHPSLPLSSSASQQLTPLVSKQLTHMSQQVPPVPPVTALCVFLRGTKVKGNLGSDTKVTPLVVATNINPSHLTFNSLGIFFVGYVYYTTPSFITTLSCILILSYNILTLSYILSFSLIYKFPF